MEAGPDLDILIAQKVMGLTLCKCTAKSWITFKKTYRHALRFSVPNTRCPMCGNSGILSYSTHLIDAWEVMEKIKRTGLILIPCTYTVAQEDLEADQDDYGWDWSVTGDSMPHAICLAALHALEPSESTREK